MQVKFGMIQGVLKTFVWLENEFVISELSHSYCCIISKVLKSEPTEKASEKEGREEGRKGGREGKVGFKTFNKWRRNKIIPSVITEKTLT